jgi:hypothetical protein
MAGRDLTLYVASKLGSDWSAASAAGLLTPPAIDHLIKGWDTLDPLVRARLLLSPLFLRRAEVQGMLPALQKLVSTAAADK